MLQRRGNMGVRQLRQQHQKNVAFMRQLVQQAIERLQSGLDESGVPVETSLCGERETFLSALVKLTQLQMKLIPLEQELANYSRCVRRPERQEAVRLTEEDWRLLAAAIARRAELSQPEQ